MLGLQLLMSLGLTTSPRVTVWWKPKAPETIASDVHGMIDRLCATDTIIYCGYAALPDGTFGIDPSPAGGWGNASLCAQAVDVAAAAGLGVQLIVEGRIGGHVKAALKLGGTAFGSSAKTVLAGTSFVSKVQGLNIDWEVGKNKSAAKPLPTQAAMDTFTRDFARDLSPTMQLSVCATQFLSTVSNFELILEHGALVYDMGLYHGTTAQEWDGKLANASISGGSAGLPLRSGALAVSMALHPKFVWENSTESVVARFAAIARLGVKHIALFAWGGVQRDPEQPGDPDFGLPRATANEWTTQLRAFVKEDEQRRARRGGSADAHGASGAAGTTGRTRHIRLPKYYRTQQHGNRAE